MQYSPAIRLNPFCSCQMIVIFLFEAEMMHNQPNLGLVHYKRTFAAL